MHFKAINVNNRRWILQFPWHIMHRMSAFLSLFDSSIHFKYCTFVDIDTITLEMVVNETPNVLKMTAINNIMRETKTFAKFFNSIPKLDQRKLFSCMYHIIKLTISINISVSVFICCVIKCFFFVCAPMENVFIRWLKFMRRK